MARKAIFLDRDGTIIEDREYLGTPSGVVLLAGVELAIQSLKQAGYLLVVVSNQSGVARGMFTAEDVQLVNAELQRQLEQREAALDGYYFCPYHPEGKVPEYARPSDQRKPAPGMLLQAAEELEIDLERSWMVGDSVCDVEAGKAAGCRTVWVRTGRNQSTDGVSADLFARNLVEAAKLILREEKNKGTGRPDEASEPAKPSRSRGVVSMAMRRANGAPATPGARQADDRQADAGQTAGPAQPADAEAGPAGQGDADIVAGIDKPADAGVPTGVPHDETRPPVDVGPRATAESRDEPGPGAEASRDVEAGRSVEASPAAEADRSAEASQSAEVTENADASHDAESGRGAGTRISPDAAGPPVAEQALGAGQPDDAGEPARAEVSGDSQPDTPMSPGPADGHVHEVPTRPLATPRIAPRGQGLAEPTGTPAPEPFSITKLVAGVGQMLAVLALIMVAWRWLSGAAMEGTIIWAVLSATFQMMSLTFYLMQRIK